VECLLEQGERNFIFFAIFLEEILVLQSVGKARGKMAKTNKSPFVKQRSVLHFEVATSKFIS
jgi:hypothetical protein